MHAKTSFLSPKSTQSGPSEDLQRRVLSCVHPHLISRPALRRLRAEAQQAWAAAARAAWIL